MKKKPKRHECLTCKKKYYHINNAIKHAIKTGHYDFKDLTEFKWKDKT